MSKIFVIIGIVLALGGSVLTYLIHTQKVELKASLDKTTTDLGNKTAEATKEKKEKEEALASLKTSEDNLTAKTAEADTEKKAKEAAMADADATKGKLATAEASVTDLTAKNEELTNKVAQSLALNDQIVQLNADLSSTRADLQTKDAKIIELEGKIVANTPKTGGGGLDVNGKPVGNSGPVAAGITGKVQAVNEGWSFVVISLGEKDGVHANAVLDVYRNNSKIGQVKVSGVEPTISTANIVSTKDGGTIEPGIAW